MEGMSQSPTRRDALFDALLEDADAPSGQIRERLQAAFAVYRAIPRRGARAESGIAAGAHAQCGEGDRDAVSDAEVAELAEIGESRAHEGVPIEVVLWGGGSP
jgi:hypothetical protein